MSFPWLLLTTPVPGGHGEVQFIDIDAARLAAVAGVVEAIDWQPDDPWLPELADRLAALNSAADNWEENATEGVMASTPSTRSWWRRCLWHGD